MITGAFEGGVLYIFTSVPQIPATSIFNKALSSGIWGIANSRISVLPGPTRTAARTFSIEWFPPTRARIHHEREHGKGNHSGASADEARRAKDRGCGRMGFPDCANCRSRGR